MKSIAQHLRSNAHRILFAFVLCAAAMLGVADPGTAMAAGCLLVTAIESQGVKLAVSSGSPTTFANIGNITDFSGPGGQAAIIDTSNLDSTFREKMMGLPDEGQVTFNVNWDPDNTTHTTLRSARAARTRAEFRITLTDATPTVGTFFGYVVGLTLSGAVDAVVKAALTIEVDGPIAWA